MALPILDGNQSATTLSTIVTGGAHVPAHTIVSLGAQAITDIATAVASSSVTITGGVYLSDAQVVLGGSAPAEAVQIGGYNLTDNKLYPIAVDNNGVQSVSGTVTANLTSDALINSQGGIASDDGGGEPNFGVQLGYYDGDYKTVKPSQPLPISGTVTANLSTEVFNGGIASDTGGGEPPYGVQLGYFDPVTDGFVLANEDHPLPISGTVTAGNIPVFLEGLSDAPCVRVGGVGTDGAVSSEIINQVRIVASDFNSIIPISGTVTVGSLPVSLSTTTIGGTARLNVTLSSATTIGATAPSYGNLYGGSDGTNLRAILVDSSGRTTVTGSVNILGTPSVTFSAIAGTVTANNPNGTLTTRFGSVVTANSVLATTCVTNASRKYLLVQNNQTGTSAGTVTIGIGFTPTTTQGIQLISGASYTADSFVPTGAVYWLGSVTGATFTILEG